PTETPTPSPTETPTPSPTATSSPTPTESATATPSAATTGTSPGFGMVTAVAGAGLAGWRLLRGRSSDED
ncbi:MAG: hypothetical protein ABEH80_08930, partial [Halobaculum sp.]